MSTIFETVGPYAMLADGKLFRCLRSDMAPYHYRAVELLWECNQLAEPHLLEGVVASRMASDMHKTEAFDAFGILWQLTGAS